MKELTEEELVLQYRKNNPKSRIVSIFKFVQNGGTTRQKACALCGECGPTWSGEWPKTKKAKLWEDEHKKKHLIN